MPPGWVVDDADAAMAFDISSFRSDPLIVIRVAGEDGTKP
jgi:hypothetical protein